MWSMFIALMNVTFYSHISLRSLLQQSSLVTNPHGRFPKGRRLLFLRRQILYFLKQVHSVLNSDEKVGEWHM